MNTQPASTIYLVDYLANHHNYIEEVTQLKMEHWLPTSPDRPYAVWLEEIAESARMDAPPITLVALHETDTDQRDLAGFVSLVQIERRAGVVNGLWMLTLYTKEAYRRRGIAQHLMQRCIEESRRLGFKALHLWTESRELTFYYAKRGWKLTGKDEESGEDVMRYTVV